MCIFRRAGSTSDEIDLIAIKVKTEIFEERKITQSRTNDPINAHLTIAQVMLRYNHNNKYKRHYCKSFVKISEVAQQ